MEDGQVCCWCCPSAKSDRDGLRKGAEMRYPKPPPSTFRLRRVQTKVQNIHYPSVDALMQQLLSTFPFTSATMSLALLLFAALAILYVRLISSYRHSGLCPSLSGRVQLLSLLLTLPRITVPPVRSQLLALTPDPFAQKYPEAVDCTLSSQATSVRFNPSGPYAGHYLAAGGSDGLVEVWDVETRGIVRQLEGHVKAVGGLR